MKPSYESHRPSMLMRCAFGVAAVAATLSLGLFIESLSSHYSEQVIAATRTPIVVASH